MGFFERIDTVLICTELEKMKTNDHGRRTLERQNGDLGWA